MGNDHVLLFHIGTLKTGTTSLQEFLYHNQDNLLKNGWDYPNFEEVLPSHYVIYPKNAFYLWSAFLEKDDKLFDDLMNCALNHLKYNNVIMSCENIWIMKDFRGILSKIHQYYENIKILVYIRRQDLYLESLYNQIIKGLRHEEMDLTQFIEYDEKFQFAQYLDRLLAIEEIFGKNLIVKPFERVSLKGSRKDIISDFLSTIEIDENREKWDFPNKQNESLNNHTLELKRILNGVVSDSHEFYMTFSNLIRQINLENNKSGRKEYNKIFSPELRKKILKNHEAENIEIARHFLNKEEGVFSDTNVDIPYEYYKATAFEEDIIKFFASMLVRQDINLSFLNSLQNKRKLAFFGAGTICRDFLKKQIYIPDIIIDNNTSNKDVNGIPVVLAKNIENWNDYHIIITCAAYKEIEIQLHQRGLNEGKDYIKWFDISMPGSSLGELFIRYRLMAIHPFDKA